MSVIRNGVILLVYLVIIICLYLFLSSPFDTLMSNFDDIDSTLSDSHIEAGTSLNRTVFDMMFAGLILVPIIWFVLWCFSREPDWRYRE